MKHLFILTAVFLLTMQSLAGRLDSITQYRTISEQYQMRAQKLSYIFAFEKGEANVTLPEKYKEVLVYEKIRFETCGESICLNGRGVSQVRAAFSDAISKAQAYENVYLKLLKKQNSAEARKLLESANADKDEQSVVLKKHLSEVYPSMSGGMKFAIGLLLLSFGVLAVMLTVLLGPLGLLLSKGAASFLLSASFLAGLLASVSVVPVGIATYKDLNANRKIYEQALSETEMQVERMEAQILPKPPRATSQSERGEITEQMDRMFFQTLP